MNDLPLAHPDLTALSPWASELAKTFVSLSNDIALVIGADGVIQNVAQGGADPIAPNAYQWVGRAWVDTVSGETRPKIENLLREVATTGIARRREVNHPLGTDLSIPVAYTAIRLGANGPVLAVGRDLRTIAAIQQRYVESQQDMERGYWQARQAEARYQLLFQVATDAVLVVDGETLQIVEANQAAATMWNEAAEQLHGKHASSGFEHHSRAAVNELLANARRTGESGEIRARLRGTQAGTSVIATPFRAGDAMRLLVRLRTLDAANASAALNQSLSRLVDAASDGVVVTDSSGRILIANPAFLSLVQAHDEAQVKGQPLMNWLSLVDEPLAALVAKVRRDGIARQVEAWVKRAPASTSTTPIGISAALLTEGDQECIGFTLRPGVHAARPPGLDDAAAAALLRVLRAGVEALGSRLPEHDLSTVVRDAAGLLGLSAEDCARRLRQSADTSTAPSTR